jgi:hypothetical protein
VSSEVQEATSHAPLVVLHFSVFSEQSLSIVQAVQISSVHNYPTTGQSEVSPSVQAGITQAPVELEHAYVIPNVAQSESD